MNAIQRTSNGDTNSGVPVKTSETFICDAGGGNTWRIQINAEQDGTPQGPRIRIDKVDSTGVPTEDSSIELDLAVLPAAPDGVVVKLRETKACDESGTVCYAFVLRSEFYYTPVGSDFT